MTVARLGPQAWHGAVDVIVRVCVDTVLLTTNEVDPFSMVETIVTGQVLTVV